MAACGVFIWLGNERLAGLSLEAGASVNASDAQGRTALMAATVGGHERLVQLLIKCGADGIRTFFLYFYFCLFFNQFLENCQHRSERLIKPTKNVWVSTPIISITVLVICDFFGKLNFYFKCYVSWQSLFHFLFSIFYIFSTPFPFIYVSTNFAFDWRVWTETVNRPKSDKNTKIILLVFRMIHFLYQNVYFLLFQQSEKQKSYSTNTNKK